MPNLSCRVLSPLLIALLFGTLIPTSRAIELHDLPVLASQDGVLDVLMVVRAEPITTMPPLQPTGWVFDICPRPVDGSESCPVKDPKVNLYGGTRLQLTQGDLLKVHLVNKLPPIVDAEHSRDPGFGYLALNPINIHTHGLLVSPHYASVDNPTYGDNVFVITLNPDNGVPAKGDIHIHGDVRLNSTDYQIRIPAHHPSGLYWFHPHVHGIAKNQINAGLSGVITIGKPTDYLCKDAPCADFAAHMPVRHIMLKDAQVYGDSTLLDESKPIFCRHMQGTTWRGSCPGKAGPSQLGGRWFFTLNGVGYPNIPVSSPGGELWRITAASSTVSYRLSLWNPKLQQDMVVQVVAVDGVAIRPAKAPDAELTVGGAKIKPVPCPSDDAKGLPNPRTGVPVCARQLLMMPSSRVELWVADRDANGRLVTPAPGDEAILRTEGFRSGPTGDNWPPIELAHVRFTGKAPAKGTPQALTVAADADELATPGRLAADLSPANGAVGAQVNCNPLAPGHSRRIFLGMVASPDEPQFGLGYEELDESGVPVPGTFQDVAKFYDERPTICLPLAAGNAPVQEHWELVNITGEDHNFHIHQTKFGVLTHQTLNGRWLPGILHDNVPVAHADGDCESVADWRAGACTTHNVQIEVPFAIAGDFVYHCHILEHEDGGMMARIRVRAAP